MKDVYQYFVEGDDEKRLIEVLKTDMRLIQPGKIQVVNVVQERLTGLKLRVLSEDVSSYAPYRTVYIPLDTVVHHSGNHRCIQI